MKKKMTIVLIAIGILVVIGMVAFGVVYRNRYTLKKDYVIVELGEPVEILAKDYINASKKAIERTKMDLSDVRFDKIGEYKAVASYRKKQRIITVIVEDTTAPIIKQRNTLSAVTVGKEVHLSDLIESVDDKGQIVSVMIKDASNKEIATGKHIEDINFIPYNVGKVVYTVVVLDESSNEASESIELNITKDYESMISGFHDFSIVEGDSIDYMDGITKLTDEITVEIDSSCVNSKVAGAYIVKYVIKGDDGITSFEKNANVVVREKPVEKTKKKSSDEESRNDNSDNSSEEIAVHFHDKRDSITYAIYVDNELHFDASFHSTWDGHMLGEYYAATNDKAVIYDEIGNELYLYPQEYIIGSHGDIMLSDGRIIKGNI